MQDGESPSNDEPGPSNTQTMADGHADGAGTDPCNSSVQVCSTIGCRQPSSHVTKP